MGNDWTRLLQEASEHGGPSAMRAAYERAGRVDGLKDGALIAVALGITAWGFTFVKKKVNRRAEDKDVEQRSAAAPKQGLNDTGSTYEEDTMGEQLSRAEQDEIVTTLAVDVESLSEDEYEELFDKLDDQHQLEASENLRSFADSAVGDEHWDSDS